jgi:hypothetical protein
MSWQAGVSKLNSIQFLCSQAHVPAGGSPETRLNSIPLLPSSCPGRLESRNSTDLNDLLCPFYNSSARTSQKHSSSIVAWIRFRGNVFIQLFHSNGCSLQIPFRYSSSIVACWHYLATAVSLAPQFLLWTNTPHYRLISWTAVFAKSHRLECVVFSDPSSVAFYPFRSRFAEWYHGRVHQPIVELLI